MNPSEQLDQELALAALQKRKQGQSPTGKELQALRRWESAREETQRWEYYRTIPQKHYREMSGRQCKILQEQEALYGLPCGGKTVDLPKLIHALHDFLAKNGHKLLKKDEDGLLGGPPTESLERLRLAKAKREEFAYERDMSLWRRADEVQQGLAVFANVIRQGIENLQRLFGTEARAIMEEALGDAVNSFDGMNSGEHDLSTEREPERNDMD